MEGRQPDSMPAAGRAFLNKHRQNRRFCKRTRLDKPVIGLWHHGTSAILATTSCCVGLSRTARWWISYRMWRISSAYPTTYHRMSPVLADRDERLPYGNARLVDRTNCRKDETSFERRSSHFKFGDRVTSSEPQNDALVPVRCPATPTCV